MGARKREREIVSGYPGNSSLGRKRRQLFSVSLLLLPFVYFLSLYYYCLSAAVVDLKWPSATIPWEKNDVRTRKKNHPLKKKVSLALPPSGDGISTDIAVISDIAAVLTDIAVVSLPAGVASLAGVAARVVAVLVVARLAEIHAFVAEVIVLADEAVAKLEALTRRRSVAVIHPRLAHRQRTRAGQTHDQLVLTRRLTTCEEGEEGGCVKGRGEEWWISLFVCQLPGTSLPAHIYVHTLEHGVTRRGSENDDDDDDQSVPRFNVHGFPYLSLNMIALRIKFILLLF